MAFLRRLGSQALVYGLGYGFTRLLGFALLPLYTRHLTPSEYGVWALLAITGQVAAILSQVGLGPAMFREVIYEETDRRTVESTVVFFLTGISAFVMVLAWFLSPHLNRWMFDGVDYTWLLRLTFLGAAFTYLETVLLARLRIEQRPYLYTSFAIARFVAGVAVTVWFLVYLERGLAGLVEATAVLSALFALVYFLYLLPSLRAVFSLSALRRLLKFGTPLVPANVSGTVTASSDRYFLQHFAGEAQVGLYSLGYTVGQVTGLFVNAIQLAWPAHLFEIARQPDAEAVLARMLTIYFAVMAWLALGVSMAAPEIVRIMSTPDYHDAALVVPWVAASYVFLGASYIVNSGLAVRNRMKYSGLATMIVALVNLGLNWWLIPRFGGMGAAWATFASYALLAMLMTAANLRVWHINYEYGRLALLTCGWLLAIWLSQLLPSTGATGIALRLGLLAAYGLVAWAQIRRPQSTTLALRD